MKKLFKILIYLILTLIFTIVLAGIIILKNYGEEIKSFAIDNLSKELEVKVEVNKVQLSLFKKFPYISIILSDVSSYSNEHFVQADIELDDPHILFEAENIYIQFNLIDLIRGNYKIKRIFAEEGTLNLLTDSQGNANYIIFKKSSSKTKSERNIELELFKLRNFRVLMINKYKNLEIKGKVDDILLKGKFRKSEFNLITSGLLFIEELKSEDILYFKNSVISTRLNFSAVDSVYTVEKGMINFDDIRLEASGQIISGDILKTDLSIEGKNIAIRSLVKKLPDNYKQWTKTLMPDGRLDIHLSARGNYSGTENPLITAQFKVGRASIRSDIWKSPPGNVSFKGFYSNGEAHKPKTSYLKLDNIIIRLNESNLSANLIIRNFLKPSFNAKLKGIVNTSDLNYFIPQDSFVFQGGKLDLDLIMESNFKSFKDMNINNILISSLSGKCNLNNVQFIWNKDYPPIENLNGNLDLKNDTWFSNIEFNSGLSNYNYKGTLNHIFGRFVNKTSSLWIQGDLSSAFSDVSFLFNRGYSEDESKAFKFPDKLFLKLNIIFEKFRLNNFNASNIKSEIAYKPGLISVSSLQLNTMKGELKAYGGIIQDLNGNFILKTDCQLEGIDIKEMFEVFNNFRQSFIISNNVEGRISGAINFSGNMNSEYEPEMKSIYALTNVIIENGELKNFSPLKNLSRFIELSELEHVKFKTLENNIIIKDKKVFVPEMAINSSAFNLNTSGIHGFDNNFEYKIKVNLSEILAKKARIKKENDEFAVLEKDGQRINLFLTIAGNPDDFKIRYDKKEAASQIKENIKSEKKELKSILYEEFGLFKKDFSDSTVIKKKEEPENLSSPKFIFEWDDDEKESEGKINGNRNKSTKNKEKDYKIIWD